MNLWWNLRYLQRKTKLIIRKKWSCWSSHTLRKRFTEMLTSPLLIVNSRIYRITCRQSLPTFQTTANTWGMLIIQDHCIEELTQHISMWTKNIVYFPLGTGRASPAPQRSIVLQANGPSSVSQNHTPHSSLKSIPHAITSPKPISTYPSTGASTPKNKKYCWCHSLHSR